MRTGGRRFDADGRLRLESCIPSRSVLPHSIAYFQSEATMKRPASLLLCLFLSIPVLSKAATVVLTDGTFTNASWTVTTEGLNLGGTGSGVQTASGGNPG